MSLARALALCLLLAPGVAGAQFLPDGMAPLPRASARIVAKLGSLPAVGAYSTLTPSVGTTFSCPRASIATYRTSANAFSATGTNTCRVTDLGWLLEEGRTNLAQSPYNLADSAHWSPSLASVTVDQCIGPDGALDLDLVTLTGSGGLIEQDTALTSNDRYAVSLWQATTSGTKTTSVNAALASSYTTCACSASNASCSTVDAAGSSCVSEITATTLPIRSTAIRTDGLSTKTSVLYASPTRWTSRLAGNAACMGGFQIELGNFATSDIPAGGARSPEQVDLGAVTLGAKVTLSAKVNLEGLPPPGALAVALSPSDGTNFWKLAVDSNGHTYCAYKTVNVQSTATVTPGTVTTIACTYNGTTFSACVGASCNGVAGGFSPAVAFTHNYVGWDGTGNYLNGYLTDYTEAKGIIATSWIAPNSTPRIAFIGDSITYGTGSSDPTTKSYPALLQAAVGSAYKIDDFGVSGAEIYSFFNSPYPLIWQWQNEVQGLHYKWVVMLGGINDIGHNISDVDTINNLETLEQTIAADGAIPVMGSILPTDNTSYGLPGIQTVINNVNTAVSAYAATNAIAYANYFPSMVTAGTNDPSPSLFNTDHLHPNDTGYGVMEPICRSALGI